MWLSISVVETCMDIIEFTIEQIRITTQEGSNVNVGFSFSFVVLISCKKFSKVLQEQNLIV